MEIVKEVRVDRLSTECKEESSFHVNITGLQDILQHGKKHKVRVKDVFMPYIWRRQEFKAYYGKRNDHVTNAQPFTVNYHSIEDLCEQLTVILNYSVPVPKKPAVSTTSTTTSTSTTLTSTTSSIESTATSGATCCVNIRSNHGKHICDNILDKNLIKIFVRNHRVVVHCSRDYGLYISKHMAIVLGFKVLDDFFELNILNEDYVQFVGRINIGEPVSILGDDEKLCHVVMDGLESRFLTIEGHFGVLFSYNYFRNECEDSDKLNTFKVFNCVSNRLNFKFFNEKMVPFSFGADINNLTFSFTLQFVVTN